MMRILLILPLLILVGCSSVRVGYYINHDKGVIRKYNAPIDDVLQATKVVLERYGWPVSKEENPSIYERNTYTANLNARNVLLMTDIKQHSKFLYSTYSQFNVFCYQVGNGTDVEIRYQAITPMIKQFKAVNNERLINKIFDDIQKEIGE